MLSPSTKSNRYLLDLFQSRVQIASEVPNRIADLESPNRLAKKENKSQLVSDFEAQTAVKFSEILSSMVSLPGLTTEFPSFRELVFAYEEDWKTLSQCRHDWTHLCEAVVSIETVQGIRNYEADIKMNEQKWRSEILAGLAWPLSIRSQLEAKLSTLPLAESRKILSESIANVVNVMANHMAYQLAALTDQKVLGTIVWHGKNACQYKFLSRTIAYDQENERSSDVRRDEKNKTAWATMTATGKVTKSIVVHTHDLIDCLKSHPGNTNVAIPVPQKKVLDAVPKWVNKMVTIVEGNLIRERIFTMDVLQETYEMSRDVTVPAHFDPAIILADSFVLTGWKP